MSLVSAHWARPLHFAITIQDTSLQVIPVSTDWTSLGAIWTTSPENTPGISDIVEVPLEPPTIGTTFAATQNFSQRLSGFRLKALPAAINSSISDVWDVEIVGVREDTGEVVAVFPSTTSVVSAQANQLSIDIFGRAKFPEALALVNIPEGVRMAFYMRVQHNANSPRNLQFEAENAIGEIISDEVMVLQK